MSKTGQGDDERTWLGDKPPGVATIGSLMIGAPAPVDEHGYPYQVLILFDEDVRAIDLLRDDAGRPLSWILTPDGADHVRDTQGRSGLRPAPDEVARSAEDWLRRERHRPSPDGGNR